MNQHCRVVPKLRNSRVVQIGHPACVSDAQHIQKWPKYAIKLGTSPHFPCVFPVFPTWLAAFLFQFGMFGVSHLQFWLAIIAHQPPNKFAFNFSLNFALNFTKKSSNFFSYIWRFWIDAVGSMLSHVDNNNNSMDLIGRKMKGKWKESKAEIARKATEAAAKRSAASLMPKTKTKDAPTVNDANAEDLHGKKHAGKKPPQTASKKPSTTNKLTSTTNRKKKKGAGRWLLPLLFQRMPQLMNFVDDPSCVDSLVNHLSSWKPFESLAAVKAPSDATKATTTTTTSTKTTTIKSAVTGSEGQSNKPGGETTTAESVGMEESTPVEAIARDEASMETSFAEAPITVDSHTQTEPVKVPWLVSRRMKIKTEDLITLDKLALTKKKNILISEEQDIHSPNGAATRAKNRCVKQLIKHVTKKDLTPEQIVLVLREASVHPDARLHFKSAGLVDSDEFGTLKFMMSQADKFLEKVLKTESLKGRVGNERREMINSFFTVTGEDDATATSNVTVPSKRRRLDLLQSLPKATGHRIMKKMQAKRTPTKEEWHTITSRKGKDLKVSEENRAIIVD